MTEDYVSFETAKLLKEKGFDELCRSYWPDNNSLSFEHTKWFVSYDNDSVYLLRPTLQMAMKWLREVHKLSIEPYYDEVLTWVVDIRHIGKHTDMREFETVRENCYKTYEEACEAAIKYCLENLI